jgi:NAD(P)-dependent dehydrogenase (short-subunit alcohol dehydrogenase family)
MSDASEIFSLKGRTILLTGASAGLGRRFAEVLSAAGATVAIVARRKEVLDAMAADLAGCHPYSADLSVVEEVPQLVRQIVRDLGPIDVLINNAGAVGSGARAEDETLRDIRSTFDLNLFSPIVMAQSVFVGMKERGSGSIINVTSVVGHVGISRFPQATYAASKGALHALTLSWAAQWARYGIRVNALAPGFFETEMSHEVMKQEKVQAWIKQNCLIPRAGRPADLDGALLYLSSDASAYVTGQSIVVDGGWTAL